MKTIYFIRHGETDANAAGKWPRLDAMLTNKGKEQAREAGREAKRQNITPGIIIASPLPRARETAELVAEELGYPADAIEHWDILVERAFGELTDVVTTDFLDGTRTYEDTNHVPGVEHVADMQVRTAKALEQLKARPEDTIIVVGHGAFARALLRVINSQPPELEYAPGFESRVISNASVIKLI